MIKRLGVLLLLTTSLGAFEDVSFSARTLGLGGDQAAVSDDAFSAIVNPALPARWARPVTALSFTPHQFSNYWCFSHVQPVRAWGCIGGSLLTFAHSLGPDLPGPGESHGDVRFFWSLPLGEYFNLGAAIGNNSVGREAFGDRYFSGTFFSIGGLAFSAKGFSLGFSLDEMNFTFSSPAIFHTGLGWEPRLKKTTALSSLLLAADGGFRFGNSAIKLHLGAESYFFRGVLGLRVGMRYGTDELSGFSPTLGVTLRTHRVEKMDFELHYGTALSYGAADSTLILHQLTLSILFGDARKAEKDSILAEQAERARRLREQALARERDKLRAELEAIKEERSALEQERKDIERLRHEALAALGRLKGIEFTENDTFIRITIRETALGFGADSAEIPFPRGYHTLDKVAAFLSHYPNNRILVEVYADIRSRESFEETPEGEPRYKDAKALAEARAQMIRRYLVEVKGLASSQVVARGEGIPQEPEAESPARQRVEITIVK